MEVVLYNCNDIWKQAFWKQKALDEEDGELSNMADEGVEEETMACVNQNKQKIFPILSQNTNATHSW